MKRTMIVLLAALLIPAALVYAQPGHPRGVCDGSGPMMGGGRGMHGGPGMGQGMGRGMGQGMPGARMLLRNADEIGLTADQKTTIEKMVTDFQMERIDKEAALEKAQVQLRTQMMKDDALEADVLAGIDKVTKLKGDLNKMRYSHHMAVRNVLTEEQRDQIKTMVKERRADRWDDRDDQRGMGKGYRRGMQDDD
ncbi:hypothetical protein KQH82_07995 [bacterium]|nr:hypothetical protein [bacterium]